MYYRIEHYIQRCWLHCWLILLIYNTALKCDWPTISLEWCSSLVAHIFPNTTSWSGECDTVWWNSSLLMNEKIKYTTKRQVATNIMKITQIKITICMLFEDAWCCCWLMIFLDDVVDPNLTAQWSWLKVAETQWI